MSSKFAKKGNLETKDKEPAVLKSKLHIHPSNKVKPAKDEAVETKMAKKSAKVTKEKAEKAPDNRKIKLLTKENPKREGSASFDRFELYRDNKTVSSFIEAGGRMADLGYDEKKGYIEVA